MAVKIRKNGAWVPIGGEKGDKGDKGVKGEKGDKGDKGFKGDKSSDKGDQGDKGDKGDKGESIKGDKGPQGNDGNEVKGDKGDKGDKGQKGDVEAKGNKGDKGDTGEKGDNKGSKGDKGDKGQKGDVEAKGNKGDKGDKGQKGDNKGSKGDKGDVEEQGNKGDQGEKGQKGDVEAQGNKGDKGDKGQKGEFKGDKGDQGDKGDSGDVEEKGNKGIKGEPGSSGTDSTGPIGQIVAWSGSTVPNGYLLCDGQSITANQYTALRAIVGNNVPDLRNRFIMGADPSFRGQTGGSADSIVVQHNHDLPRFKLDYINKQHDSQTNITLGSGQTYWIGYDYIASSPLSSSDTGNRGSSGTNANLPPYYKLAYIIKFSAAGTADKGQKGEPGSTSGVTITNHGNNRLITSSSANNVLNGQSDLTWDGMKLDANHGNGYVHIHPSDGCIEIYRSPSLTPSGSPFIDFKNNANEDYDVRLYAHSTQDMLSVDGSFNVDGNLSKNTGSFKIPHPLPALNATKDLIHSFIEGPQMDLIYRGKIDLVDGTASINIDNKVGMTQGTFVALNRDIQCFTSNETGWTAVKGTVSGNVLTITAQPGITTTGITTNNCTDTVSWMVIGERQDSIVKASKITDDNGNLILEPDKIRNPFAS